MPDVAELDNAPAPVAIEGSAAAAILLMLLDESEAATILKQLGPEEVRQLAKAMFDTANASEQQIGQALDRFVTRSTRSAWSTSSSVSIARAATSGTSTDRISAPTCGCCRRLH